MLVSGDMVVSLERAT